MLFSDVEVSVRIAWGMMSMEMPHLDISPSRSRRTVVAKCTAPPHLALCWMRSASMLLKNLSVSEVKGTSTKGLRESVKTTAASSVRPGSLLKVYNFDERSEGARENILMALETAEEQQGARRRGHTPLRIDIVTTGSFFATRYAYLVENLPLWTLVDIEEHRLPYK